MSHTIDLPDGYYAIYNADFSGDIRLHRGEAAGPFEVITVQGLAHGAVIPFSVFVALVAAYVRDKRLYEIEQASEHEILGVRL